MQAVILAAGMGTRIKDHFSLPKGFIPIADKSIIIRSIEKLKQAGVKKIAIIAGHLAEYYLQFAHNNSNTTVIINDNYNKYGSLYSLYCAKDWIQDDFLLLESDILYEKKALKLLIQDKNKDVILVSGKTNSGDEVYVQSNKTVLVNMSKHIGDLDTKNIVGEFVGINKLSLQTFQTLIAILQSNSSLLETGYYEEHGLVNLAKHTTLSCLKIPDLLWTEIDNITQLENARLLHKKIHDKEYYDVLS